MTEPTHPSQPTPEIVGASRRRILGLGAAAAVAAVPLAMSSAQPADAGAGGGTDVLNATAAPYSMANNGTTVITAAQVTSLLNDAKAKNKTIYFPAGAYLFGAPWPTIDFNLRLIGDGCVVHPAIRPVWGASMAEPTGLKATGTRLIFRGATASAPAIRVIDAGASTTPVKDLVAGPWIEDIGIFSDNSGGKWSTTSVGLGLGTYYESTTELSYGHPVRPRLRNVTVACFGVGIGTSASCGTFDSLHLMTNATGFLGTFDFNGNTITGIDVENSRDVGIKLNHAQSNVFNGGVMQNNVLYTGAGDTFLDSNTTPPATRSKGASIYLTNSCLGNVFTGLYLENGFAPSNAPVAMDLRDLVVDGGSRGNHFIELRWGTQRPTIATSVHFNGGNNNVVQAQQGTFKTVFYANKGIQTFVGEFAKGILGGGEAYSRVSNYYEGNGGWYTHDYTTRTRRYTETGFSDFKVRTFDQIVFANGQNKVILPAATTIRNTFSVVIYAGNSNGGPTVSAADGKLINGKPTKAIPALTSIEFMWTGKMWITM